MSNKRISLAVATGVFATVAFGGAAKAALTEFDVDKVIYDTQTGAAQSASGAQFDARVEQTAGAYTSATLTYPGGSSPLTLNAAGTEFSDPSSFATKAAADAAFPIGTYTATVNPGGATVSITETALNAYPSAVPFITNYAALAGVNATAAFTVTFSGFTPNANASVGYTFVDIYDAGGTDVFSDEFLSPTATSVTLPGGTLVAGQAYTLVLDYSDRATGTSNGVATNILYDDATLFAFTTAAVPEPASLALLGMGVFGLGLIRRRAR